MNYLKRCEKGDTIMNDNADTGPNGNDFTLHSVKDKQFIEAVTRLDLKDPITKEPVTPVMLIDTLKDDVVYAVERPGSWEGANMLEVLYCHGFLSDR
jgi:hypothetical protein